jgi:lipoyl(octanoyl) transferase
MKQRVIFEDLGLMDYKSVWDYQENLLRENVKKKSLLNAQHFTDGSDSFVKENHSTTQSSLSNLQDATPDTHNAELNTRNYLLFVEHLPVFTLGKSGNINNVLLSEERLKEKGIGFFKTNRGGDITFHGPQQIVGYPILDLEKFDTDIGHYLRNLEEVMILTLKDYGIRAGRSGGETGVWIDADIRGKERKICAIGVRCSRWITMHGFAFNINTDLNYFNYIIPCGIQHKQVTSLKKELGTAVNYEEAKEKVKRNFEIVFNAELVNF